MKYKAKALKQFQLYQASEEEITDKEGHEEKMRSLHRVYQRDNEPGNCLFSPDASETKPQSPTTDGGKANTTVMGVSHSQLIGHDFNYTSAW